MIYLDNNSSTPIDPKVLEVFYEASKNLIGNPSSAHFLGRASKAALLLAQDQISSYLGKRPQDIYFNSGATEGINHAFFSIGQKKPGHIITSKVEHACVMSSLERLIQKGFRVSFLSPGMLGAITKEAVLEAIQEETCAIALMAVNNETGVKTDIKGIAEIALEKNIAFIVDGVALLGKENFEIPQGVSVMCFSGHKLHAPKGVGFSFVDPSFKMDPFLVGGEQERNRRSGTENLPGIVALGKAVELLKTELPKATVKMCFLRDLLEEKILALFPSSQINGKGERICNTSNIAFLNFDGEFLLMTLDLKNIAVSLGSACSSGALEPSRVLLNMGISPSQAASSLRFSLSRMTTQEEIETVIKVLSKLC